MRDTLPKLMIICLLLMLAASGSAQAPAALADQPTTTSLLKLEDLPATSFRQTAWVRFYRFDGERASYELLPVPRNYMNILVNYLDLTDDAVMVMVAEDQREQEVAGYLKAGPGLNKIAIHVGRGPWSLNGAAMPPRQLLDFEGKPIDPKNLELSVLLRGSGTAVGPLSLDSVRQLEIDLSKGGLPMVEIDHRHLAGFLVRHPDYGQGWVGGLGMIPLPLIHRDSPARANALAGVVRDPDGRPVPDVLVGGADSNRAMVFTDAEGRFLLPMRPRRPEQEALEPSRPIQLRIQPPRQLGLRYQPRIIYPNPTEPLVIDLVSAAADSSFHILRFEVDAERLGGRDLLETLSVTGYSHANRRQHQVPREVLMKGGMLPHGLYDASCSGPAGPITFEQVSINARSPEEVVFRALPAGYACRGRVIDARDGRPLPGIRVVPMRGDQLKMTAEQWEAFERHQPGQPIDPILQPLTHSLALDRLAITDDQGGYVVQASPPTGGGQVRLRVLRRGWSMARLQTTPTPDAEGFLTMEEVALVPTARVTVTPKGESSVSPSVNVTAMLNLGSCEPRLQPHLERLARDFNFIPPLAGAGTPLELDLPAEAAWRLSLNPSHAAQDLDGVVLELGPLAPGQQLDLGEQILPWREPVMIRVLDEAGAPQAGLTLHSRTDGRFSMPIRTDAQGQVLTFVSLNRPTQVCLLDPRPPAKDIKSVEVLITGKETDLPVFELVLTAAELEIIRSLPQR